MNENTGLRDLLPYLKHRDLGRRIYMQDIDMLEYSYKDGEIVYIAIIDCKHGNVKKLSSNFQSFKLRSHLAQSLSLPFFTVITYLDPELFPIPMYYVKPVNKLAKDSLSFAKWMTPKQYAQFQHTLRDLTPYPNELIHLSNEEVTYPLPTFDY